MKSYMGKFNTGLLVALTATVATVAQPQPASAQLLEIAAGALNSLVRSKQPQPQIIQQRVPVPVPTPSRPEFNVGTNNANGNHLNLCISNCLPAGAAPARIPAPIAAPAPVVIPQQVPVPVRVPVAQQQSSVSSGTAITQNGAVGGTSINQTSQQTSSQSAVVQNR